MLPSIKIPKVDVLEQKISIQRNFYSKQGRSSLKNHISIFNGFDKTHKPKRDKNTALRLTNKTTESVSGFILNNFGWDYEEMRNQEELLKLKENHKKKKWVIESLPEKFGRRAIRRLGMWAE